MRRIENVAVEAGEEEDKAEDYEEDNVEDRGQGGPMLIANL